MCGELLRELRGLQNELGCGRTPIYTWGRRCRECQTANTSWGQGVPFLSGDPYSMLKVAPAVLWLGTKKTKLSPHFPKLALMPPNSGPDGIRNSSGCLLAAKLFPELSD